MKQKTVKINAKGKILGRLATQVANILRGKTKTDFTYHKISGDKVCVYNISDLVVTGNKNKQKKYYQHTKYIGNLKEISYQKLFSKNPCKVFLSAVRGMLPKNRLQKIWLKNLILVRGNSNE